MNNFSNNKKNKWCIVNVSMNDMSQVQTRDGSPSLHVYHIIAYIEATCVYACNVINGRMDRFYSCFIYHTISLYFNDTWKYGYLAVATYDMTDLVSSWRERTREKKRVWVSHGHVCMARKILELTWLIKEWENQHYDQDYCLSTGLHAYDIIYRILCITWRYIYWR
jgi:hypothetical protein